MATINHSAASSATALTVTIDSLTNGEFSGISTTVIDNATNKHLALDFWIELGATGINPAAGAYMSVYLIPLLDGATYPDVPAESTTSPGEAYFGGLGSIADLGSTGNLIIPIMGVSVGPYPYKIVVGNFTGVTLSTGNTIKWLGRDLEVA